MPIPTDITFTPFRGDDDLAAMVRIHELRREVDQVDRLSTRESWMTLEAAKSDAEWSGDPHRNILFAQTGDGPIGYALVTHWQEPNVHVFLVLVYVIPAHRGQGIEGHLLNWAEDRSRALAAEIRATAPCTFAANASETESDWQAVLQRHNYTLVRTLVDLQCKLGTDVPVASLPQGIEVRPLTRGNRRQLLHARFEAFKDEPNIFAVVHSEAQIREFESGDHLDTSLWQIAWDGDEIVGGVQITVPNGRGIFDQVWIRRPWRRRGIATALMRMGLGALRARGIPLAMLHTDAANAGGALNLYAKVGFHPRKHFHLFRKPF